MIGIIDYQAGNLTSMLYAVEYLGYQARRVTDPEELVDCSQVIFPGVGEARAAMDILQQERMDQALREFIRTGRPLLGVCIGAQILLSHSEERNTVCLDIIPGQVRRFSSKKLKVPQIGWNALQQKEPSALFRDVPDGSPVYYVNSYYMQLEDSRMVLAQSEYGLCFDALIRHENVVATQFHPEKSGPVGLQLLNNFLRM